MIAFDTETLREVAESVCLTMFETPVHAAPATSPVDGIDAEIGIDGAWQGSVRLICPPGLLDAAAASMFRIAEREVSEADRRDALAELVNMLGGTLKSLLPEPCRLGLPAVNGPRTATPADEPGWTALAAAGTVFAIAVVAAKAGTEEDAARPAA